MCQTKILKFRLFLYKIIISKNSFSSIYQNNMLINTQTITIVQDIVQNHQYSCQLIRINNSQKKFMMKTITLPPQLSNQYSEKIMQEIKVLASLNISCFVKYVRGFIDSKTNRLSIIFDEDLQQFSSLQERVNLIFNKVQNSFNEAQILQIGKKLLQIILKLHENSIIHGNINSKSILIDKNNNIKLGQVNPTKIQQPTLRCNSYINGKYSAPEIQNSNKFLQAGDIWSLGCVLYQLATTQPYFQGDSLQAMANEQFYQKKATLIPESFSQIFRDTLKRCLLFQYQSRPKAAQILENQLFEEKIIKIQSSSKIKKKISSLKKIGRIGTNNAINTNEKKKAVHFQENIHRTSIMDGGSLVELLEEQKKDLDSDSEQAKNKSKFNSTNNYDYNSDEQQQKEEKEKFFTKLRKRNSENLTQPINLLIKSKTTKNTQGAVKDKKFMSNSFMNYLDSYKKQKLELFKIADSLIEQRIVQQPKQNLILKQSSKEGFFENNKFMRQYKDTLPFKIKDIKKYQTSAKGYIGLKKQNKFPFMESDIGRRL